MSFGDRLVEGKFFLDNPCICVLLATIEYMCLILTPLEFKFSKKKTNSLSLSLAICYIFKQKGILLISEL